MHCIIDMFSLTDRTKKTYFDIFSIYFLFTIHFGGQHFKCLVLNSLWYIHYYRWNITHIKAWPRLSKLFSFIQCTYTICFSSCMSPCWRCRIVWTSSPPVRLWLHHSQHKSRKQVGNIIRDTTCLRCDNPYYIQC